MLLDFIACVLGFHTVALTWAKLAAMTKDPTKSPLQECPSQYECICNIRSLGNQLGVTHYGALCFFMGLFKMSIIRGYVRSKRDTTVIPNYIHPSNCDKSPKWPT